MYVLAPSLTPRGQDSEFRNGRNGKKGVLSHSIDVIDACTCTHNSECVCICYGCMVDGNVAMTAF